MLGPEKRHAAHLALINQGNQKLASPTVEKTKKGILIALQPRIGDHFTARDAAIIAAIPIVGKSVGLCSYSRRAVLHGFSRAGQILMGMFRPVNYHRARDPESLSDTLDKTRG